jgi:uncharacterized oxidoreductase
METKGNTILITGGATGIGLALAEEFLNLGNEVIVCGRREEKLRQAKKKNPRLHTRRCDVSKEEERKALHDWVVSEFPETNVLVNNAGVQKRVDLRKGTADLLRNLQDEGADEIDINLKAYVYLAAHFIPDLQSKKQAAIVNVSSGLGFLPIASMPVYCATKAAVHSFSVSLRHQLKGTSIKVFEVIPPMVDTDLDKGARGRGSRVDRGMPPQGVAKTTVAGMEGDETEITIGAAQGIRIRAREDFEIAFEEMNRW